jgi:hypothetical protein
MNTPKTGTRWTDASSSKRFRVLHTIEMNDGHTWVHYCDDKNGEKEYSCYLESFLERFRETI